MKLRKKVFALLTATVFVLSLMVSTALAEKNELPFTAGGERAEGDNDVWIQFSGGDGSRAPLVTDDAVRDSLRSADVIFKGNATFDVELINNTEYVNWTPTKHSDQSVDGELVINHPIDGSNAGWVELIINVDLQGEGDLKVAGIIFKDGDNNAIATMGETDLGGADTDTNDDADSGDESPSTGVLSTALFLGLGATALGTGTVLLKKKEEK